MKNNLNSLHFAMILFAVAAVLLHSCKKDDDPKDDPSTPSGRVVPTATTDSPSWIRDTTATLNGTVKAGNDTAAIVFEFGTTSQYGQVLEAIPGSVTGNESEEVTLEVNGLDPGTRYFFRVRAINSVDTAFGTARSFTTFSPVIFKSSLNYGSLADIEGNTYHTIAIGTQVWMAENLRTATLNDGTAIPQITETKAWEELTTSGYCWYNNSSDVYGALYNWHAVNTGKLCPDGWHVPDDGEWSLLTDYLGGAAVAGLLLREEGTLHWQDPNAGVTNASGFTALPGGYRTYGGTFGSAGRYGYWWSATQRTSTDAFLRALSHNYSTTDRSSSNKKSGLSVRCVMD